MVELSPTLQHALLERLTAWADDELILAHRDSEWTGHAPILEEDIAVANFAQDEIGHAMLFYDLIRELGGPDGDQLAMFREAADFRNVPFVELPKGDWAFTIMRQYLFDAYEYLLYRELQQSRFKPLADIAAKVHKEEMYHLRHTHIWVERLGLGTAESNRRMQQALDDLWSAAQQLFEPLPTDRELIAADFIPDVAGLHAEWMRIVIPHIENSELQVPESSGSWPYDRTQHSAHLTTLLADMQLVARSNPSAESW